MVDIHLEAVLVAAQKESIDPGESDIAVKALDSGEGEKTKSTDKQRDLTEVLASNSTFPTPLEDETSKDATAESPG